MLNKIRVFISFIINGVVLSGITYALLFDSLAPKKLFSLPYTVIVPLCLILITALFSLWLNRLYSRNKDIPKISLSPSAQGEIRKSQLTGIISILVLLVVVTIYYVNNYNSDNKRTLVFANKDFVVQQFGSIPKTKIDSTLIALERGLSSVRLEYGVQSQQTDNVYLFPDAKTMQYYSGQDSNVSGSMMIQDGQIYILLPVEKAINAMQNTNQTSTPLHEATHVVFAEILGEKMYDVPLWFLEGTAQYEEYKNAKSFPDRITLRFRLWQKIIPVIPESILLLSNVNRTDYESESFYSTSYELARYLAKEYGVGSFARTVKLFSSGLSFDSAFQTVYGMSQEQAYQEWYQKFF